jgi:uncharacterized protein YuzE
MISTTYDPDADAMYVRIAPKGTAVAETREAEPGIMFDVDANGVVIGIEVLGVRARSTGPATPAVAA